jgi:uncharacterized membrane protein
LELLYLVMVAAVLPLAAIGIAVSQRNKIRDLLTRQDALGKRLQQIHQHLVQLQRQMDGAMSSLAAVPPAEPRPEPESPLPTPEASAPPPEIVPVEVVPVKEHAATTPVPPPSEAPHLPAVPMTEPPPAGATPAASSGDSLERQLSTRVAVWLGAAALALAGAFLVKYSIERGLIGPTARVALAFAFGLALLVAAEWLRERSAHVAQGLAASGIAVLFAALLAGVRLYELIPPVAGFAGLLLTTAAAVLLSERHGQLVAILGLLGGFLTPLWIGGATPRPWMLLGYLLLLQVGLMLLSYRMRWWPVASLTGLGALAWGALWMAQLPDMGDDTLPVGLLLLASMVGWALTALASLRQANGTEAKALRTMLTLGSALGVLLLGFLVGVGDFGNLEWAFLGLLGAGALVLARRDEGFAALPWITMLAAAGMLMVWGLNREHGQEFRIWTIAWLLGALYIAGAYVALWGSPRPERWAALSGGSGLVYLLAAYLGLSDAAMAVPWGLQSVILAAVMLALTWPVMNRRELLPHGNLALVALAVTITCLASVAVPMELERAWVTVAWALEIPALAWIASRLRVPALEKAAWALGGLAAARLLLNPFVLSYPIGEGLVLNWLLYGYGISAAAFALGAVLFRQQQSHRLADALERGAVLIVGAFVTLEVRQFFHPGRLDHHEFPLMEWGGFCVAWLGYAVALFALHARTGRTLHRDLGLVFCAAGLVEGLLVTGLGRNPMLEESPVGEMLILNRLLFLYALPALLAAVLAWQGRRMDHPVLARAAGSGALLFAFLTITLQVRQAFHGTLLEHGETTNAEMYTYSLVWVLFATTLLVAGVITRGAVLRFGSAAVMLLAVGKVFLVDTAHLEGLLRVFSLLGLGASLMLLAFLYQRFVFRDE